MFNLENVGWDCLIYFKIGCLKNFWKNNEEKC